MEKSAHGLSQHLDLQQVLIDSTITRAHIFAQELPEVMVASEVLSRSKGGFTTKIHAIIDGLGSPLGFSWPEGRPVMLDVKNSLRQGLLRY
ncbi:MAG: hypothetical protein ACXV8W_07690 [Methylobacter sp.]